MENRVNAGGFLLTNKLVESETNPFKFSNRGAAPSATVQGRRNANPTGGHNAGTPQRKARAAHKLHPGPYRGPKQLSNRIEFFDFKHVLDFAKFQGIESLIEFS